MTDNNLESFKFDDKIVKWFLYATILWAGVAMLVGLIIASQLADWRLNLDLSWFTFGRLRPLHTNSAIFAFAGNAIFAGIYHSSQRLLKTSMLSTFLSKLHFWGWQLIIVLAAVTIPLGISTGKEYAELEWPIDILITLVWVIFAVNFFGALYKRKERHIYVSIWFYIATIVAVAVLHIVNSLALPVSLMQSYPVFAGIQDALIQWWYGHNAVAFFLTTPFLGLMYYYIPKAINKPVYSYRLSIIHFWSLVFLYIWAGPHHLLYSALPEWAQTVGMVFSVMLWAPSWGGMINGLLTLRGGWDRVRKEPVFKFFVAAITFYGMSTFEGPLLSIKSVNALAHFTDWIVGHTHSGALGWNGFWAFGMIYYLVPKLWKTKLKSDALANTHFWLATIGIILYVIPMMSAGITQGLMWRAISETGMLVYPDFMQTVTQIIPLYTLRLVGGTLYFIGYIVFVVNIWQTIASAPKTEASENVKAKPLSAEPFTSKGHRKLEGLPFAFAALTIIAILVGSIIELVPSFMANRYVTKNSSIQPYSPLELTGRDIYVREGCYLCHSQMVRPLPGDVLRYGHASEAHEYVYDRPFQWGSKRTGPDLARVGGKYPDLWHFQHMKNPRSTAPKSIMPNYPWLFKKNINTKHLKKKMQVNQALGVPYTDEEIENAKRTIKLEAQAIAENLVQTGGVDEKVAKKEIVALIAYLQRLKWVENN
jgi:cytochrome c oxidase cbb3-type subunit I/II